MKRTVKKYYSRGNVGAVGFNNKTLEKLAEKVEALLQKGYSTSRAVRELELPSGITVDYTKDSITLKDKRLDSEGNSWGVDNAVVKIIFPKNMLSCTERALDKCLTR